MAGVGRAAPVIGEGLGSVRRIGGWMTLRNNTFRVSALAAAAVLTFASGTGCGGRTGPTSSPSAPAARSGAPVNHYLAAPTYGIVHMDSSQSDTFPYPAPRGVLHIDPRTQPRVAGGPVNYWSTP